MSIPYIRVDARLIKERKLSELSHDALKMFIGICYFNDQRPLPGSYVSDGSLQDITGVEHSECAQIRKQYMKIGLVDCDASRNGARYKQLLAPTRAQLRNMADQSDWHLSSTSGEKNGS
jgi:hypothetical protein